MGPAQRVVDPESTRARRSSRRGAPRHAVGGLLAVGAALALVVGCASGSSNDVVAAGPVGTNPESPAVDNPTTSALSTTVTSGAASSSPTTDPDAAASTSTSVTSVPPAVSVPTTAPAAPSLTAQIFWVRLPGDDRAIDIPGYRDPDTGPKPLVLYGSVTNTGSTPVANPFVTAVWLDAGGATVAAYTSDVVEPGSTTAATELAPGQSGDVIVVVTDATVAAQLADLVPQLNPGSRS